MKRVTSILLVSLLFVCTFALADSSDNYDAANAKSTAKKTCAKTVKKSTNIYSQASTYNSNPSPTRYYALMMPGSLQQNIIRIGHHYGWQTVVWNAQDDYTWVGKATISSDSVQGILSKILVNYPLQAQFYQGNRVLAIVPRNLP